jgi:hypothetical protein
MRIRALSFLVILIMGTAIDGSAQYPSIRELREEIERLERELRERGLVLSPELRQKYLLNKSGRRQYCAADHGSAPPSRRPHRWCEYNDMASCLEATRDHSNYSCEKNLFYGVLDQPNRLSLPTENRGHRSN